MKKYLLLAASVVFLVGCGSDLPVRPMEAGNDGRIQQYLEENILDSENAVCNFDLLNQPNGNVVEVWALCEEFVVNFDGKLDKEQGVSLPVKITFANPSMHVVPMDGAEYEPSIRESFSDIAIEKIFDNSSRDIAELERRNLVRATKWLAPVEVE